MAATVPSPRHAPAPSLDSVTTIRADGSRPFLYPTDTHGRFTRARRWSALALIAIYFGLPWIPVNGYPAVFLDLDARRFHLFGVTLAAQDLWLLFFLITGVGFSLIFVTALLGRVWCGWACPHTVFLDHVYRRIERWIEGDATQRRMHAAAPMSFKKAAKRTLKHAAYFVVSAAIAHLFLAYFVSLPKVWSMVGTNPAEHWGVFAFMAIATGVLHFNFAWFREQLCIVLCPYGRMQSALIDDHSLVIGYDWQRGEPRGRKASAAQKKSPEWHAPALTTGLPPPPSASPGDCVDCLRCVHVCPTGIDIRQGLQLECIGCAACIDACDDVMDRLHKPRGLIRYDSQEGLLGHATRWIRPRTVLYALLLAIGAGVAGTALSTVRPANLGVTRITGAPYILDQDSVRNQFLVRLVNKRSEPVTLRLKLHDAPASVRQIGFTDPIEIWPLGEILQPLILQQSRREYDGPFHFRVEVSDAAATFRLSREVEFVGPEAQLLREEETESRGK